MSSILPRPIESSPSSIPSSALDPPDSSHSSASQVAEESDAPTFRVTVYPIRPTGCPDENHVPYTALVHDDGYSMVQVVFGHRLDSSVARFVLPASKVQAQEAIGAEGIRLSWITLIPVPFEFTVDGKSAATVLYYDALQHLQSTYSPSSLVNAIKNSIQNPLSEQHPSLSTLVNCLADRYSLPGHPTPDELSVSLYPTSVLDFIIFGMLYVVAMNNYIENILGQRGHFLALMEQSKRNSQPSMLYQATLLDIVTSLWHRECWDRHRVRWSPMPWSRVSMLHPEAEQLQPTNELDMIPTPTASALDKLNDEDYTLRTTEYMCGHPIDIPWLGAPHDGHPFSLDLHRYVKLRRQALSTLREDAALWLNALTFGILEAVLGIRIPEALTLCKRGHDGKEVISGARLSRLMHEWQVHSQERQELDRTAHVHRGREVARLLNDALLAIDEVQFYYADPFTRAGIPPNHAIEEYVGPVVFTLLALCTRGGFLWVEIPEFNAQMARHSGRLYHTFAEMTCQKYMTSVAFIRNTPDEHQHCTDESCNLFTITDTSAYVPRHTSTSCQCGYIVPPFDAITQLLSEGDHGSVPIVVFDGQRLLVERAVDRPYVAISHVWADGLGSTTEQGLPGCQVARLAALVQSIIPTSGGFWMDSLCVPDVKDLRKRAIKLMAKTYKDAASVLVIDATIMSQCHSQSRLWRDNLFRIATSGWVRRVWTLQEGILARKLYFQFADGPVDVDERLESYMKDQVAADFLAQDPSGKSEPLFPVHFAMCLPLIAFRGRKKLAAPRECTFGDVAGLLRLRTTSKAEDETVAIAGLLPQVDVGALLAISGPDVVEQRMKAFLIQLREIPRFLPILNDPKIELPGFRWAPRTLASVFNSDSGRLYGTATCTESGLSGVYNVFRFHTAVKIPSEITRQNGKKPEFLIWITERASDSVYEARILLDHLQRSAHYQSELTVSRPSTIDALLFIHDDGPLQNDSVQCAAVLCRSGVVGGDGTKDEPFYCDHVSTGRFNRIATTFEEFQKTYVNNFGFGHAACGEFGKAHVYLT
ncbi:hypothetical protein VNI00_005556 [Paramarasmius palmivorus]|uniref:Heterokaryon incompatibility domain-containing protein n=1 Tax=Paramarasmius palmivorus TaxID=297713 RepID=A0AAW0DFB8_9AGAR